MPELQPSSHSLFPGKLSAFIILFSSLFFFYFYYCYYRFIFPSFMSSSCFTSDVLTNWEKGVFSYQFDFISVLWLFQFVTVFLGTSYPFYCRVVLRLLLLLPNASLWSFNHFVHVFFIWPCSELKNGLGDKLAWWFWLRLFLPVLIAFWGLSIS